MARTDNELLTAVGRGDLNALGTLFERHHDRVHRWCFRLIGDNAAADDLVQDSFVRILRYSKSFESRASFTTWLYRLVRNVCIDYMNAESRVQAKADMLRHETLDREAMHDEEDPRLDTVRKALYRLSPEKREILVLSRYEGLSYAEIAEICETTVGAIKVRAHRAMRELRQQFEELEQAHEV